MRLRRWMALFTVLAAVIGSAQLTPAFAAGPQLVVNPSFESSTTGTSPSAWSTGRWGTNTATFTWITSGRTGSRAARVQITSRSSGDAKWTMDYVPVTAGTVYTYSGWYRANVASSIVAEWRTAGGALSYQWLRDPAAATNWTNVTGTFTAPAGATSFRVFHLLARVGWLEIDDVNINGPDTTPVPPTVTVNVTAPTAGATVSGSAVALAANATATGSPAPAILGVTFAVDGVTVGTEDTTAPYTGTWNTTAATNGTHTVTALARTATGTTTSPGVAVTVDNVTVPATPNELVPNPSVETAAGSVPASWQSNAWGSISATFSHPATGGHSGTRFVRTQVTARSSGDAKWYFAPQPITAGTAYTFSDWYRANVNSQVVVAFGMSSGSTQYVWLGDVPAASSWTRFGATINAPSGATNVTVFHLIASVGWLETDDYSLTPGTGPSFNRPLVSLTFDDGWASHATQALPMLQQFNVPSTFYITTGFLNQPGYLTTAQMLQLFNSGHEIGSHTVTHAHLTQLNATELSNELVSSRQTLEALIGRPVPNFATPFGEYNASVLSAINATYATHRTVADGCNTRSNLDVHQLRVKNVFNTTTRAEVESWLAQARSQGCWLILVLHDIRTNPGQYDSSPTMLNQYLQAVQASGVAALTVEAALQEVIPQAG